MKPAWQLLITALKPPPISNIFVLTWLLICLNSTTAFGSEYDFIIVGGGTAGCLLASRLSEISNWKVLLIEAGGEENFFQDIPLLSSLLEYTPADWKYRTEHNGSFCNGFDRGQCHWPRGKVLGGTSVFNYMTYVRGNKRDYDDWESLGNTGWGYADILPYFLKFENMKIPRFANDTENHSTHGELFITNPPYHTNLATAFVEAGIQRGYNYVDYNVGKGIGYSYLQSTMKDGLRWSSNYAFLRPIRNRRNLDVRTRSLVTKILIDKNRVAYGVEYKQWGFITRHAFAKKEVILAAGAINSPQLLMLSGIGPKEHLEEKGISVLQDSKVGFNLMDHVSLGNLYYTLNETAGLRLNLINYIKGAIDLILKRPGIFNIPGGSEAIGFESLGESNGYPDIELLFASATTASTPIFWSSWGPRIDILFQSYSALSSIDAFMVFPLPMKPNSRGRIMLKSTNPSEYPLIYPNYFSDPKDIETIIKGIRLVAELSKTEAMKKYDVKLYNKPLYQCSEHEFDSDAYWECCIRYLTFSYYHICGTCKMGPDSDPDAVVDTELRVRGIKHLRVVDASIMPIITSGHITGPVYMIAEKASDMIKNEWS
ncbi:Glucose dehydrogenase [FAD, quinone] [Blattella germanica]|nr:Glucose dehydrogenase [FAD, quinone] [Blattella germanica]